MIKVFALIFYFFIYKKLLLFTQYNNKFKKINKDGGILRLQSLNVNISMVNCNAINNQAQGVKITKKIFITILK